MYAWWSNAINTLRMAHSLMGKISGQDQRERILNLTLTTTYQKHNDPIKASTGCAKCVKLF